MSKGNSISKQPLSSFANLNYRRVNLNVRLSTARAINREARTIYEQQAFVVIKT